MLNIMLKYTFPFLAEHHTMKAYWRVKVYINAFFDLGTRWR